MTGQVVPDRNYGVINDNQSVSKSIQNFFVDVGALYHNVGTYSSAGMDGRLVPVFIPYYFLVNCDPVVN